MTKFAVGNVIDTTVKGNTLRGRITELKESGKSAVVSFADGETRTIPLNRMELVNESNDRKRGRPPRDEVYSPDEIARQVEELLEELRAAHESKDIRAQKRIRAKLRDRHHKGGLTGARTTVVSRIEHEAVTGEPVA